jgi:hypothetical protein
VAGERFEHRRRSDTAAAVVLGASALLFAPQLPARGDVGPLVDGGDVAE